MDNIGKYKKQCKGSGITDIENDWVVYTECLKIMYLDENVEYRCASCAYSHKKIKRKYKKLISREILKDRFDIIDLMPSNLLID